MMSVFPLPPLSSIMFSIPNSPNGSQHTQIIYFPICPRSSPSLPFLPFSWKPSTMYLITGAPGHHHLYGPFPLQWSLSISILSNILSLCWEHLDAPSKGHLINFYWNEVILGITLFCLNHNLWSLLPVLQPWGWRAFIKMCWQSS